MLDSITSYINAHYGSRRGLLNHYLFGARNCIGQFRHLKHLEWQRIERLVFICHGNICRSPLAAAYADQLLGVATVSFGLSCRDGAPADPRAIRFADACGVDLRQHTSRHLRHYRPVSTDLIVGMEPKHLMSLSDAPYSVAQLTLAGLWLPLPNPYIHDPFMSGDEHFVRCEQTVTDAVVGLAENLCRASVA